MKVIATNHTSFTVADLDATVSFFTEALGFTVRWPAKPSVEFMLTVTGIADADARVAVVMCPGHAIELFQYDSPANRRAVRLRACDVGFSHIAFQVDDIEDAIERAARHGFLPSLGIGHFTTLTMRGRGTYLRGPDGLAIELVELLPANVTEQSS